MERIKTKSQLRKLAYRNLAFTDKKGKKYYNYDFIFKIHYMLTAEFINDMPFKILKKIINQSIEKEINRLKIK